MFEATIKTRITPSFFVSLRNTLKNGSSKYIYNPEALYFKKSYTRWVCGTEV